MMDHKEIAEYAIAHYPIQVDSMEFISQSGAAIYKIKSTSGTKYCLRLYTAINNALGEEWTAKEAIHSMLQWMDALAKDRKEITIPNPLYNLSNELVTTVNEINCTVENWLEGEHRPYFMTEQDAARVGVLLARLHGHAAVWQIPPGFQRPQFDSGCIRETLDALKATTLGFSDSCMKALEMGAHKVIKLLDAYERTKSTWGIIHADVIPPNLLYDKDEIRPIDFGACGFGYYLWDIATTMPFVPLHFRKTLLDAYSTLYTLPERYVELLEGFFIACRLQVLGFFLNLPDAAEWVPNEYEKLSQRELHHYLNGESFLFEGTPYYE